MHTIDRVVREILNLSQKAAIVLNEDEDSNTPLHLAAARGHAYACELLLEKGANLKDRWVRTSKTGG